MPSKGSNHRPKEDHLNAHLAQILTEQLRIKVLKTKEAVNLDLKQ